MYDVINVRKYTSVVKISYSINIRNADDTYKREREQDMFHTFTRMHRETVSVAIYNTVFIEGG